ncbi:thaumatin, partial [Chytriomyces cf. hyalinus JEL632]
RKFTLINKCKSEVWPALQGAGGTTPPFNGGIPGLKSGQKVTLRLPNPFLSGRIWPRTDCRQGADGKINCLTGDCEYGVECGGLSNRIPATLLEFSLDASGGKDYYDLSLVDGYSIGLGLQVSGGSKVGDPSLPPGFDCGSPGCGEGCSDTGYCCSIMDLRRNGTDPNTPPSQQGHGKVCLASSWPTPLDAGYQDTQYDKVFKSQCPDAYSWQFDDESSLFQCVGAEYELTFCP